MMRCHCEEMLVRVGARVRMGQCVEVSVYVTRYSCEKMPVCKRRCPCAWGGARVREEVPVGADAVEGGAHSRRCANET